MPRGQPGTGTGATRGTTPRRKKRRQGTRGAQLTQQGRGQGNRANALRNLSHNELVEMVCDQSQTIATQAQIIANL